MRTKKKIIQKLQQIADSLPLCEKRKAIKKRILKLKIKNENIKR
tara:strand:- start:1167 stop:1298 length:132 start_codon:yes stop_codon:yes gene_type:complete